MNFRSAIGTETPSGRRRRRLSLPRVWPPLAVALLCGVGMRLWLVAIWRPGFTGYSDSGIYFMGADTTIWSDPIRMVGYALVLRLAHLLWPALLYVIVWQHLLGLVGAGLLYAALRRLGLPRPVSLVPAAFLCLDGDQLMIEHAALADGLYIFLTCLALYLAARSRSSPRREPLWAVGCGVAVGFAIWLWGGGFALVLALAPWFALRGRGLRRRGLATAALFLVGAGATVGVYAVWRALATEMPGILTSNNAYNLYARVAPWANCAKFTPPPGTSWLCQYNTPAQRRAEGFKEGEAYIYASNSPAYRLLGPPYYVSPDPNAMADLTAFSLAAIEGEPLEYLHAVWLDLRRLYNSSYPSYGDDSAEELARILAYGTFYTGRNPFVEGWQRRLYPDEGPPSHGPVGPFLAYERATRLEGPGMVALLALAAAAPFAAGGRLRRRAPRLRAAALLCGLCAGWGIMLPILVKGYDYRFLIPTFGPLVAAAAIGAYGLAARVGLRVAAARGRAEAAPVPG